MKKFINKEADSIYYNEELDIINQLIEDGVIIGKDYFNNTENSLFLFTVEQINTELDDSHNLTVPVLKSILHYYGEKATEKDDDIVLKKFYETIEPAIAQIINIPTDNCEIFLPIRVRNMILVIGYLKYSDGLSLVLGKTVTGVDDDLFMLCGGICGLLHSICMMMSYGRSTVPDLTLEGYIIPETSQFIARNVERWFNLEPPVVIPWIDAIAKAEAKDRCDALKEEWKLKKNQGGQDGFSSSDYYVF